MKLYVNAALDYCLISSPVEEEKAFEDFSAEAAQCQEKSTVLTLIPKKTTFS